MLDPTIPPPLLKGKSKRQEEKRLVEKIAKDIATQEDKINKAYTVAKVQRHNLKKKKEKLKILTTGKSEKPVSFLDELPPRERAVYENKNVIFQPHRGPQTDFLAASEDQVFYGGARGGGKSYAMLVDPLRYCDHKVHRALMLRRTMPELRDLIEHSRRLYPQAFPGAKFKEQEKEWRFPSGARIEFGYAETMADALRYQGQSYTWIGVDELPQFPSPEIWNFLMSSLRSTDPAVPTFMRATGNPGNVGSHWVREMFIDAAPPGEAFKVKVDTSLGPRWVSRRFIPAKLTDNPSLMQTDSYLIMLSSLPEVQRKQYLDGDWDAFDNAAFPEFSRTTHVFDPFEIPKSWIKFRSCDWGYSSNACVLWFAVDYDGNLYVYRELYTKGLTADIFALKIKQLEENDNNIRYGVMDSSVWAKRGDVGPGIVETMWRNGVQWRPSDRSPGSRKNSKLEVHRRLGLQEIVLPDGKTEMKPRLKISAHCVNLIRTLPQLPLDPNEPEDVDTTAEDHAYDALRYGCMSRPLSISDLEIIDSTITKARPTIADRVFGY